MAWVLAVVNAAPEASPVGNRWFHPVNIILLGPSLLILIKRDEMKTQSFFAKAPPRLLELGWRRYLI
ncbi:hypothetical protein D3C80_2143760 [compost metagenome]